MDTPLSVDIQDLIDFFSDGDEIPIHSNEDVVRYLTAIKESHEEIDDELRSREDKSEST